MVKKTFAGSRKKYPVTYSEIPLFFSLVDYRNNYFTRDDPNKIIEFYNGFENRDQLIRWLKERPKGVTNLHEVDGDKDIIVVIPTADVNGKYARECRDNIFKGLHIIFVESGQVPDPYFNYAHNCNVGIRKAMQYNPKWVVVSNDDMYKIDHISVLIHALSNFNETKVMSVFTKPSKYHSYKAAIGLKRLIVTDIATFLYYYTRKEISSYKQLKKLQRKFGIKWFPTIRNRVISHFFYKQKKLYILTSSFAILSSNFCIKRNEVFNETYCNGVEDWELSLDLDKFEKRMVSFRIGDMIGSTIGKHTYRRILRDIVNLTYFQDRIASFSR